MGYADALELTERWSNPLPPLLMTFLRDVPLLTTFLFFQCHACDKNVETSVALFLFEAFIVSAPGHNKILFFGHTRV